MDESDLRGKIYGGEGNIYCRLEDSGNPYTGMRHGSPPHW